MGYRVNYIMRDVKIDIFIFAPTSFVKN